MPGGIILHAQCVNSRGLTISAGGELPGCSVHGHRQGSGGYEPGRPVVQTALACVPLLDPEGAPILPPVGIAPGRTGGSRGGIADSTENSSDGQERHSHASCQDHESRDRALP